MHLKRLQSQTEPWARKQKEEEREEADKTGEWGRLRRCGKDSWAVWVVCFYDRLQWRGDWNGGSEELIRMRLASRPYIRLRFGEESRWIKSHLMSASRRDAGSGWAALATAPSQSSAPCPPPPTTVSTYPVLHIHLSHHHLFLICPFFFFLLHLHFYFSDFLSFSFSCFLYLHSSNSPLLSFTKFPIFLCNSFLTSALLFPLFLSLLSNLSLFSSLLSWPPFIPYSLF